MQRINTVTWGVAHTVGDAMNNAPLQFRKAASAALGFYAGNKKNYFREALDIMREEVATIKIGTIATQVAHIPVIGPRSGEILQRPQHGQTDGENPYNKYITSSGP